MKWLCKFIGEKPYFRIVYSDSINDASKQAERYTRKGYKLSTVVQVV